MNHGAPGLQARADLKGPPLQSETRSASPLRQHRLRLDGQRGVGVLVTAPQRLEDENRRKRRAEIQAPKDASKAELEALARACEEVQKRFGDQQPRRVIVVPGRLVNFVV